MLSKLLIINLIFLFVFYSKCPQLMFVIEVFLEACLTINACCVCYESSFLHLRSS